MSKLHILIAEDSQFSQFIIERVIKELGHSCEFANDGEEAYEKALSGKYNIILMDIEMPKMNGDEVVRKLNTEAGANIQNIPIIALTAHKDKDFLDSLLRIGFKDYLPKPFSEEEFNLVINKVHHTKEHPKQLITNKKGITEKLYDLEYIRNFSGNDENFVREMVQVFVDDTPEILEKMRKSFDTNNINGLKNEAHKFSPRLSFLGISSIVADVDKLEEMAAEGDISRGRAVFEKINAVAIEVVKQLNADLNL